MNSDLLIQVILLSILPISELRGAIPLAIISGGSSWFFYVVVSVLANIAIIPVIFYFLDHINVVLLKFDFYRKLFDKWVVRTRKKVEKHIGTKWEYPAIYLFVAIPLPMTGAYTGVLAAWLFGMNRAKVYRYLISGVITAGIIVTLVTLFFTSVF
mgnify:CR=1 FL=1|jgi:uncharacterized membrane protein